jgi:hypothetical protein
MQKRRREDKKTLEGNKHKKSQEEAIIKENQKLLKMSLSILI